MVERVHVDSEKALRGAELFKEVCESVHIQVPPLQKIFGVLIATKLFPSSWETVVSRAYPREARNFMVQIGGCRDKPKLEQLKENPVDALHILAIANLSTEAPMSGLYQQFCVQINQPQTPTSQMMFFAVGCLQQNPHIFTNQFMSKVTAMSQEQLRKELVPQVSRFALDTDPRILQENYGLLLSGINFELQRLDKKMLNACSFPCQSVPEIKMRKQRVWAALFDKVEQLKELNVHVNERTVPAQSIADAQDLIEEVDTIHENENYDLQRKPDLLAKLSLAKEFHSLFEANQLSEKEICQRAKDKIAALSTDIAFAKQRSDHSLLRQAGLAKHLQWKTPHLLGMNSQDMAQLLSQMRMIHAQLVSFEKKK